MKKIVIVDDDRVTLTMLQMLLTKSGYLVLTAQDGEEGLELAQKEKPDLLITDMLIPKVDGLELCRRIKGNPKLKDIKVILISAVYKSVSFKFEAKESGAADFIEKPVDTAKLINRVKVLLGNEKEKDKHGAVKEEAKDET
ncbi:MAG: PleD family two-component system response regulator [Candidatus Aminicenantales bacterium]